MQPLHARYPYLSAAREAVDRAEIDLGEVIATETAVTERALERVESAIAEGTIGDPHRRIRVELLSYPVARVLVSLVDQPVCTRKYARAEAETAHDRFTEEFEAATEFRSTSTEQLTLDQLLSEFDLVGAIREIESGYRIEVGAYLDLAADQRGDQWRLVNRPLSDGWVRIGSDELYILLKQAIRHRVEEGLPVQVPDQIGDELETEVTHLEEQLAALDLTHDIDTVVPELFPPCMQALLDQIQKGEHLEHHSRFAIAAFLTSIGMTTDEIVDLFQVNPGFGEEATRYQVNHIRGETSPTEYSTPSCSTMQSYGDCVNMDNLCEKISHPMAYYEKKIDDADEDELSDWREENADA
jgi:DNA primase large subunit